jgi:hypothetical protein
MKCQTEGCDKDADFAVQVMSTKGYRVGMCKDCAIHELTSLGVTDPSYLIDSVYSHIITEASWWREHFFYDTPSQIPYIDNWI